VARSVGKRDPRGGPLRSAAVRCRQAVEDGSSFSGNPHRLRGFREDRTHGRNESVGCVCVVESRTHRPSARPLGRWPDADRRPRSFPIAAAAVEVAVAAGPEGVSGGAADGVGTRRRPSGRATGGDPGASTARERSARVGGAAFGMPLSVRDAARCAVAAARRSAAVSTRGTGAGLVARGSGGGTVPAVSETGNVPPAGAACWWRGPT